MHIIHANEGVACAHLRDNWRLSENLTNITLQNNKLLDCKLLKSRIVLSYVFVQHLDNVPFQGILQFKCLIIPQVAHSISIVKAIFHL